MPGIHDIMIIGRGSTGLVSGVYVVDDALKIIFNIHNYILKIKKRLSNLSRFLFVYE